MSTITTVNPHSVQKQHKPTKAHLLRRKCGYHVSIKDMKGKVK